MVGHVLAYMYRMGGGGGGNGSGAPLFGQKIAFGAKYKLYSKHAIV